MVKGKTILNGLVVCAIFLGCSGSEPEEAILLEDNFSGLDTGMFSAPVGPHTEYHYLPEAAPRGNWAVSCFSPDRGAQRAWQVKAENGDRVMAQTFENKNRKHTHPMVITGDTLWTDYTLEVRFAPEMDSGRAGIVFRYRNDRCYYFFGLDGSQAVLKLIRHATDFHKPYEKILDRKDFDWTPGNYYTAVVTVSGDRISAGIDDVVLLEARDSTFPRGKVGLTSDVPARYSYVKVTTTGEEKRSIEELRARGERELEKLRAANPKLVLWKKISTEGFGVGRNLRFGDLDGDGECDVLIGQVKHHAWPRDSYSEISCLTAMTFDGKILWQIGTPDPEKNHLTNDVSFQIHDLDADGRNEVVYCMNMELVVVAGATGKTKYKAPTPVSKAPADSFPHILGDCLYFCDLRGTGHPRDIIIKDRYWHLWALNDRLQVLWEGACKTGHYPFAYDVDEDGRDELAIGYSLFDDDGRMLWSLDTLVDDHADGVAVVDFMEKEGSRPRVFYAASDAGVFFTDLEGEILKHHWIGHGQNPAVADFRPDMPGLETVTINFWGNQGIMHFYDSRGDIYHDFEPNQYGSMCLPINWTGTGTEYFVHSPNIVEGGMFDGWGRPVVAFPDDGHPDMCNAVLDITGDCRDEVVVWDPHEIWVYTQDDNPRQGRLYKPRRNPLCNYSNYQTTLSLPGWSE